MLDSRILVVGAMVIGPEFGAIAALGVGLVRRRVNLLGRAAATFVAGFAVSILVTLLLALLARAVGWVDVGDITADRPQTGFVYTPDRWSFVVALAGWATLAGQQSVWTSVSRHRARLAQGLRARRRAGRLKE